MKNRTVDTLDEQDNHKWPSLLVEVADVIANELNKQGETEENASKKAKQITFAIGCHFGGSSFYLPSGHILKTALRDYEIFQAFNGANIKELVHRFNLSESSVYAIIRKHRKLQKERNDKKFALH